MSAFELVKSRIDRLVAIEKNGGKIKDTVMLRAFVDAVLKHG